MTEPLITVIVPVYKVESYLDTCVNSIINQDYSNIEIILVDDGSPDECPALCDAFYVKDNRIRVIHQDNQGLSGARNSGLEIARGEYICFVDSDDSLIPGVLRRLLERIQKYNLDILGFNSNIIEEGKIKPYINYSFDDNVLDGENYLTRMIKAGRFYEPVWLYLYKTEIINSHNLKFEPGRLFEDELWTLQAMLVAKRVSYVDIKAYNYVIRPNSITTSSYSEKKFMHHHLNCKRMLEISTGFKSNENRRIFNDYVGRVYMESVKYLDLGDKQQLSLIDKSIMRDNIKLLSSKIKYAIFCINKRMYYRLKGIKN